jgi:hypothetical protein
LIKLEDEELFETYNKVRIIKGIKNPKKKYKFKEKIKIETILMVLFTIILVAFMIYRLVTTKDTNQLMILILIIILDALFIYMISRTPLELFFTKKQIIVKRPFKTYKMDVSKKNTIQVNKVRKNNLVYPSKNYYIVLKNNMGDEVLVLSRKKHKKVFREIIENFEVDK